MAFVETGSLDKRLRKTVNSIAKAHSEKLIYLLADAAQGIHWWYWRSDKYKAGKNVIWMCRILW